MINGICHLTVIPMRAEPSHRSEMVSQLLFGETYAVMENLGEWVRVRSHLDQYEGWIQGKQYFEFSEDAFEDYLRVDKLRLSVPFVASSVRVPKVLTMGALMVTDPERSPFSERAPIPNAENWWPADGVPDIPRVERLELLRKLAHSLLGTPLAVAPSAGAEAMTMTSQARTSSRAARLRAGGPTWRPRLFPQRQRKHHPCGHDARR